MIKSKFHKMLWIFGIVFALSIPLAFAQPAFLRYPIVILWVNVMIVWFILFSLQAFLIPQKEGKEKLLIWVITFALAFIIAWTLGGGSAGFIWEVGMLSTFFNRYIIVNLLLVAAAIWFTLGFLQVNPEKLQGKVGLVLLSILIAGMVAVSIGDKWLWSTDNYKVVKDYLFEPQKSDPSRPGKTIGGILRPEQSNKYRLFVFFGSAFLFAWFFAVFLKLDQAGGKKLTWFMAAWLGATLARGGADSSVVIGMAEIFLIVIIAKQVSGQSTLGMILGWGITILIVEYLFRQMYGSSAVFGLISGMACSIGTELSKATWWGPGYISSFFGFLANLTGPACTTVAWSAPGAAPSVGGAAGDIVKFIGKIPVLLIAGILNAIWESIFG